MTNKIDQRRGGLYFIDKRPYVSVTNILKILDKPALTYWYGREVYRAFAFDPTLDEKTALAAPYQKRDKAADRGSTVHSIIESYKHTKEHIKTIPDSFNVIFIYPVIK